MVNGIVQSTAGFAAGREGVDGTTGDVGVGWGGATEAAGRGAGEACFDPPAAEWLSCADVGTAGSGVDATGSATGVGGGSSTTGGGGAWEGAVSSGPAAPVASTAEDPWCSKVTRSPTTTNAPPPAATRNGARRRPDDTTLGSNSADLEPVLTSARRGVSAMGAMTTGASVRAPACDRTAVPPGRAPTPRGGAAESGAGAAPSTREIRSREEEP
jgi:hypothetical protein